MSARSRSPNAVRRSSAMRRSSSARSEIESARAARERPLELRPPVARFLVDDLLQALLRRGDVRLGVSRARERPGDDERRAARERARGQAARSECELAGVAVPEREHRPAAGRAAEDEQAEQDEDDAAEEPERSAREREGGDADRRPRRRCRIRSSGTSPHPSNASD